MTSRREFLLRSGWAVGALASVSALPVAQAVEPAARVARPRLMLSIAAYSFRQFFKDGKGAEDNTPADRRIDMLNFIDYCAEHDCGAEVTSYYFPAPLSNEFLLKVKQRAFLQGVPLSGTSVGNTFTHPPGPKRDAEIRHVKQWIDHAALLGAPHIRVFAGNAQGTSKAEAKKLCIEAMEDCCDYAGRKGVFLGIENHGGIVAEADDLLEIVRAVKSPWCGINLDTGNFRTTDPYRDLERCAPYAVNVQWKSEIFPRGGRKQESDLKRIVNILRNANYRGYVVLEFEAEESPWAAVPRLLKQMRELVAG